MFPGFFLSFLYLVYIVGWALLDPKIAPQLPEAQTRVPVPDWVEKFQALYTRNLLAGFFSALFAPARARELEADGKPLGYLALLNNFTVALVPLLLTVATMGGTYWYVVLYKKEIEAPGVQQLGAPGLATAPPSEAELGVVPTEFYWWFWGISAALALVLLLYYRRMDAPRFVVLKLLTSSVMPLGILTVVVLAVILF